MEEFQVERNVLVAYNGEAESVTVPDGIKAIGDGCFRDKPFIKEIKLPAGLEKVGAYAFAGTGITSLSFDKESVEIGKGVEIKEYAFAGCHLEKMEGYRLIFKSHSLEGVTVAHIYDEYPHFYDDCGLQNCTVHSGGAVKGVQSSYFVWEFCVENIKNGVNWAYINDGDVREKQLACANAKRDMEEKEAVWLAFQKSAKLGVRGFFLKNSPKTLALQQEAARLEQAYKEAKKIWWDAYQAHSVASSIAAGQNAAWQEFIAGKRELFGSVSVEGVMKRMQAGGNGSSEEGAFVPVPDVTGI